MAHYCSPSSSTKPTNFFTQDLPPPYHTFAKTKPKNENIIPKSMIIREYLSSGESNDDLDGNNSKESEIMSMD